MNRDTKSQIIDTISKLGRASVTDVVKNLPDKKSRQWISSQLSELAKEGRVVRSRNGKFIFYVLPDRLELIGKRVERRLTNRDLDEDLIFDELNYEVPFLKNSIEDVRSILRYSFTEMVNNAIEHSQSSWLEVIFEDVDNKIVFEVRDNGIGAFKNIMQKKNLASELEAIQELLKGKTTTLPHSHSGEGIFFTSKIADVFILDSFDYRLRVDNVINDIFIEKPEIFEGTKVRFEINKNSNKHLNDVFFEYQAEPDSYAFDKTKVHVKLYKAGTVYISRSQARRLMGNLEKFKLVILDFEGIDTIGQAFADEVFRVFLSRNPHTTVDPINISETVKFMIERVQKSQLQLIPAEKKAENSN